MKTCRKCNKSEPDIQIAPKRRICLDCKRQEWREYAASNKDKRKTALKEWQESHVEYRKLYDTNQKLIKNYGITLEEYNVILKKQNKVCAACFKPESVVFKGKIKALAVDHCHITNVVRGLLCNRCNVALGMLLDDVERVKLLYEYILSKSRRNSSDSSN